MRMKITARFEVEKFNGDHFSNYIVSNGNYGLIEPSILEYSDLGWLLEEEFLGVFESQKFILKDVLEGVDKFTEFVYIDYEISTRVDDIVPDGFYIAFEFEQKRVRYE